MEEEEEEECHSWSATPGVEEEVEEGRIGALSLDRLVLLVPMVQQARPTCSLCLMAMFSSQVSRRSGEVWYPLAILEEVQVGVEVEVEEQGQVQHLYMRSMCISGSSLYSFIFTVSDRIMCRLNTRSCTCQDL